MDFLSSENDNNLREDDLEWIQIREESLFFSEAFTSSKFNELNDEKSLADDESHSLEKHSTKEDPKVGFAYYKEKLKKTIEFTFKN